MARNHSFVIITPHALQKGQTGAVIMRLLARTGLTLQAAQIIAADKKFIQTFADAMAPFHKCPCQPEYIRKSFGATGKKSNPFLALLLHGKDAVKKVNAVVGSLAPLAGAGTTIRDSFAEVGRDAAGNVVYFEPCVLAPETQKECDTLLPILADMASRSKNIVKNAAGADGSGERTLVMIKPENWLRPGIRPGAILDIFTATGLFLCGCKIHHISVADALDFYGPVQGALRKKLAPKIAAKAQQFLTEKFSCPFAVEDVQAIGEQYADDQFFQIIRFMSGNEYDPGDSNSLNTPGKAQVMVLIFEGKDAVGKIRTVLGPTDPGQADGGTVRGEFGTTIMINAAHASDSAESFVREGKILQIERNDFSSCVTK